MKDIQPDLQTPRVQIVPVLPVYLPVTNQDQRYIQTSHAHQYPPFQHVPFTGIPKEPFSSTGGLPPTGPGEATQGAFWNGAAPQGKLHGGNSVYIPAYYLEYTPSGLQRKEPGLGETLLGCGLLLAIGIIGIAVLYFLSASAM